MARRSIWQKPAIRLDEESEQHRKVTWLELFFDLFFVVAVAQLGHMLAHNPTADGLVRFVLLFMPVFWVWIGMTYYNERFETEGLENRLAALLLMLPVIGMSITAHHALDAGHSSFTGFALSYAAARLLIIIMWARATWHDALFRPVGVRFVSGFVIALALVVAAAVIGDTVGYWLFGIALVIDVGTPFTTLRLQATRLPAFSTSKLPERFGLFVIVVLGETVAGVVNGVAAQHEPTNSAILAAGAGTVLGFGLWWVYFDFIARRPFRRGYWAFAWSYLHMPLMMSIVACGAGISYAVAAGEGALPAEGRWMISLATGAALLTMAVLEVTLRRGNDEPTHPVTSPAIKAVTGAAAMCTGFLPIASSLVVLLVLCAWLYANAVYGAWVWFRQELPDGPPAAHEHAG